MPPERSMLFRVGWRPKGEAIEAIAATCVAAKGRPGKRAAKGCARLYVLGLIKGKR